MEAIQESYERAADFYKPLSDWEPVDSYPCMACLTREDLMYENCPLCGESPMDDLGQADGRVITTINPKTSISCPRDPDETLPKWIDDLEQENIRSHVKGKHVTVPNVPACVARPVGKKELEATPKAIAARQKEWKNLADKKTWNFKSVREWRDVARSARSTGKTVHLARIFGLCVKRIPSCRRMIRVASTSIV